MSIELEVGSILKTETAFDKDMTITYQSKEYRVILHWDWNEGFEATWLDDEGRFVSSPEWAIEDENFLGKLNLVDAHKTVVIA
jgi:hypothetical protein